ncbi:MAG: class I SAM-dependent methyltransferase [Candidatus Micrarchaeota archaeon]
MKIDLSYEFQKTAYDDLSIYPKLKELREKARKVGEGRKLYQKMLETYVPLEELPVGEKPKILSVGCGISYEALVLSGHFGKKPGGADSSEVEFTGIDLDKESIESAIKDNVTLDFSTYEYIPKPNYQFFCMDARLVADITKEPFDVVVASHPEVWHNYLVWQGIFDSAYSVHKPGGLIISTTHLEEELDQLEDLLKNRYKIMVKERNIYPHDVSTDMLNPVFTHKYVLVGVKE